jgi:predicted ester cyclase
MGDTAVVDMLRRDATPEEYRLIRQEWKTHSLAEDARDLAGLISTLTEDCVYEVLPDGHRWEGHAGARRFYTELLTAFPDIRFDLTDIVIGPQGVAEVARVTATHRSDWLDRRATGGPVSFTVVIFFPWDRDRRKFRGERVHVTAMVAAAAP